MWFLLLIYLKLVRLHPDMGLLKPHAKEALASRVCPEQRTRVEAKWPGYRCLVKNSEEAVCIEEGRQQTAYFRP